MTEIRDISAVHIRMLCAQYDRPDLIPVLVGRVTPAEARRLFASGQAQHLYPLPAASTVDAAEAAGEGWAGGAA